MKILLLGNFTFHHFTDEELTLFKSRGSVKALCHELDSVKEYEDPDEAYKIGDEAESYIVLPDFSGELVFENQTDKELVLNHLKKL